MGSRTNNLLNISNSPVGVLSKYKLKSMIFVDTNIFLRLLLGDNLHQHRTAKTLFLEGAAGKKKLLTSLVVFFEIYWVLSSYYQKNKSELSSALNKILDMEFISLKERPMIRKAVQLFFETPLCLEDCYNIIFAQSEGAKKLATFDRQLQKHFSQPIRNVHPKDNNTTA